ncbi:MAG: hypothetical protein M1833_006838 [Piccolia ochrophora]|nr:MAG: hypothetical protein M1833_006838 [Piccolia ochrophora]
MPRIHILGLGNIGNLVAHALGGVLPQRPPITLLAHRSQQAREWVKAGRQIELITNGVASRRGGYDFELIPARGDADHSDLVDLDDAATGPISNVIVCTKAFNVTAALSEIQHRLTPDSTILFTQNGMGVVDEVNRGLFKNPDSRPKYLYAIVFHGLYTNGPFSTVHAGIASVTLGAIPRRAFSTQQFAGEGLDSSDQHSCYLTDVMLRDPSLNVKIVSPTELLHTQLVKLAVNAVINPLTSVLDCFNGELFADKATNALITCLIQETSSVLQALPEVKTLSKSERERFRPEKLTSEVQNTAQATTRNRSSMLQDIAKNRKTEIDYINGYIVRRGKEVKIECKMNSALVEMIKERRFIAREEILEVFSLRL